MAWRPAAPPTTRGGRGGGRGGGGGPTFSIRPCVRGAACDDPAFHHGGALCRFSPNCHPPAGRPCPFHHPVVVETRAADKTVPVETHDAPSLTDHSGEQVLPTTPRPSPSSTLPLHERVSTARSIHQELIAHHVTELRRLEATATRATSGDGHADAERRSFKFALHAKMNELEKQQRVFDIVTQRTEARQDLSRASKYSQLARELGRFQARRAITAVRLEIEDALESETSRFVVVKSSDGCGASLRIPQYAAELPRLTPRRVLCVEPTKIKAQQLAFEITRELRGDHATLEVEETDRGWTVHVNQDPQPTRSIDVTSEADMLSLLEYARRSPEIENPLRDVECIVMGEADRRSAACEAILKTLQQDLLSWRHIKVVGYSVSNCSA